METTSFIEFRKVRSVGEVINATFQFLRVTFRPLGKALLYIVGPPVLLTSAFLALFQVQFYERGMVLDQQPEEEVMAFLTTVFGSLGIALLLSIATSVLLMTVVFCYIRMYQARGSGDITVEEVWTEVKANIGRILGTTLVFVLFFLVPIPVVIIPCLGALAYLAWMVYAGFTFSIAYPIRIEEPLGVFEAFGRARDLVKGHFWQTAGALFLAYLISSIVSNAFGMPAMIVGMLYGLHSLEGNTDGALVYQLIIGISTVLQVVASMLFTCIPLTAIAFQYYSLVEQHEHAGLLGRIEAVHPAASSAPPAPEDPLHGPTV